MFAVTLQGGQCLAMPDVCQVPAPPAPPIPTPFPNVAMPMIGNPAATKVFIAGTPALHKGSKIPQTDGNQPGVIGGVISGTIMGQAEFLVGSMTVKLQGNPAVRLGDLTKHNNGNAFGAVLAPSQTVVMIMS